ncbi:Chaperone SurA precursor [Rhodobacteraceae bacterium THAF1]|nr:Chaperone SurA precursor [Palleronia sp. THAF1]VDC24054.1 Chaperone SurA precursor [Rhodobacteraceae bacterium THAF1]
MPILPDPKKARAMKHALRTLAVAALLALSPAVPGSAQNMFAPAASVNDMVVTQFEVEQRARMLEIFRAPDASADSALDTLINERLQLAEAARLGLTVTDEELMEGMTEFAGRANLGVDEFVGELQRAGVDRTSFEDFVRAGVAWREVIVERFGGGQIFVPEDDVERAADSPPEPGIRYLLNEVILPANSPQAVARADALTPQILAARDFASFQAAARTYSASPSRARGGAIDWLEAENLPPQIRALLNGLAPGEVAGPVPLPNARAFFQLRQIGEVAADTRPVKLDYAAFYIPGGQSPEALSRATQLRARIDTCDDLYSTAQGLPPEQLQRDVLPVAQVPQDVALELAKLDENEVSTALTRANGQTLVFLMLCDRSYFELSAEDEERLRAQAEEAGETFERPEGPNLDAVRRALQNQRGGQQAQNLLAELRANATITRQ